MGLISKAQPAPLGKGWFLKIPKGTVVEIEEHHRAVIQTPEVYGQVGCPKYRSGRPRTEKESAPQGAQAGVDSCEGMEREDRF